jgi:hypothetical protein
MPIKDLEQNYFIWHEKKGRNVRQVMRQVKKKVNLGILRVDSQDLGIPIMFGPLCQLTQIFVVNEFGD